MCLADFIDPDGEDWIGGFAVGIHGIEPHLERFKRGQRRLFGHPAEGARRPAGRELRRACSTQQVREQHLGLCRDEHFTNQQLIREKYHGIRPAPGYPACPDHSLKPILFDMLGGNPAGSR